MTYILRLHSIARTVKKCKWFCKFCLIFFQKQWFFAVLLKCSGHSFKTDAVTSALKIIDYNYCSTITIEQIAEYLSVDPAYFSRRFAQKIGVSPKRYIIKKRIERAKELLCSNDAGVFEIANSVGYEDQFYFYKIFKKYTNLSPSEYRKTKAPLVVPEINFQKTKNQKLKKEKERMKNIIQKYNTNYLCTNDCYVFDHSRNSKG